MAKKEKAVKKKLVLKKKAKANKVAPKKGKEKGKAKKAAPATAGESFEYGVDYLAEKSGLQPATVRRHLRDKGVSKTGKVYGWNKKSDADAVAKQIAA